MAKIYRIFYVQQNRQAILVSQYLVSLSVSSRYRVTSVNKHTQSLSEMRTEQ